MEALGGWTLGNGAQGWSGRKEGDQAGPWEPSTGVEKFPQVTGWKATQEKTRVEREGKSHRAGG